MAFFKSWPSVVWNWRSWTFVCVLKYVSIMCMSSGSAAVIRMELLNGKFRMGVWGPLSRGKEAITTSYNCYVGILKKRNRLIWWTTRIIGGQQSPSPQTGSSVSPQMLITTGCLNLIHLLSLPCQSVLQGENHWYFMLMNQELIRCYFKGGIQW